MASNEQDTSGGGGGEPEPAEDSRFFMDLGPKPGIQYPLKVIYCGECSMPVEYCEFHPNYEKCKKWMEDNLSDEMKTLVLGDKGGEEEDGGEGETKKKRQTRGGRGVVKSKKKQEPTVIGLSRAPRGKRKYVTVITGLATHDISLKDASKYFAGKFSCGSSVTGPDEIVIQGDVKDDLWDLITEKWPQIDEDSIEDLGDLKR